MSPIFKLKTFHEYKAHIIFKFANKDSIINFGGNSLVEDRKYLVIESSFF